MAHSCINSQEEEEEGHLTMATSGPSLVDYDTTVVPSMLFAVPLYGSQSIGLSYSMAHSQMYARYSSGITAGALSQSMAPIYYTTPATTSTSGGRGGNDKINYATKVFFPMNNVTTPVIPTILLHKNNSQKNAYTHSLNTSKTNVHGNEHSIMSSGQKKNLTTLSTSSTSSLTSGKSMNKNQHQKQHHRSGINKRSDNKNYEHPWLMTTLKGHTDQVYDIDFSSNGKYLASCSEATSMHDSADGDAGNENRSSSSSNSTSGSSSEDSPKQLHSRHPRANPITGCTTKTTSRTMSRRQRKNRKTLSLNSSSSDCSTMTIDEKENKQSALSNISNCGGGGTRKQSKTRCVNLLKIRPTALQEIHRIRALTPPLREHLKLNLAEDVLATYLQKYTLKPLQLREMGFPFEYGENNQAALIKVGIPDNHTVRDPVSSFDVNAREFVPRIGGAAQRFYKELVIVNKNDGLEQTTYTDDDANTLVLSSDSGQGSGSSSPPSVDSDSNDISEDVVVFESNITSNECQQIKNGYFSKECIRCKKPFYVSEHGKYLTSEHCIYHWGRRERVFKNGTFISMYSCCGSVESTNGCTFGELHVWTGIKDGFNGPLDNFVITQPAKLIAANGNYGIYAVDCEMCFTANGLELTKVTLVNSSGALTYETLVKPIAAIIDYNTRFSGITEKDLAAKNGSVKSLCEVQTDLLQIICAETILIGHALDNDLRALKIIHNNVIDTSNLFPHIMGLPYRRSLKSLTKSILKRDIQTLERGHCSFEDSRASLELLLWVVRNEIRSNM